MQQNNKRVVQDNSRMNQFCDKNNGKDQLYKMSILEILNLKKNIDEYEYFGKDSHQKGKSKIIKKKELRNQSTMLQKDENQNKKTISRRISSSMNENQLKTRTASQRKLKQSKKEKIIMNRAQSTKNYQQKNKKNFQTLQPTKGKRIMKTQNINKTIQTEQRILTNKSQLQHESRMKHFLDNYKSNYGQRFNNKIMPKREEDRQHEQIQNITNQLKNSFPLDDKKEQKNDENKQIQNIKKEMIKAPEKPQTNHMKLHRNMFAYRNLLKNNLLSPKQVLKQRYEIIMMIGRGLSGEVYKAKDILANRFVAIKSIQIDSINEMQYEFLKTTEHKNIVCYYNNLVYKNRRMLVLEYFPFNLFTIMKKTKFKEAQIKSIFRNVVSGLSYLHSNNIAHRDIKLQNIVISQDKSQIKLIDFGLSVDINQDNKQSKQCCGTMQYMAPEILQRKSHSPKLADIWSLGVLLYVLCFERYPHKGRDQRDVLDKIRKKKIVLPSNCDQELKILLESMLEKQPEKRTNIVDVSMSSWLH